MSKPSASQLPSFSPAERLGLRDFWEVYEANFDAIQAEAGAKLAGRPNLAAFARGGPRAEVEKRGLMNRERLRRALLDLELDEYAGELRQTGRRLAQEGVDLPAWIELIGSPRSAAIPFLFKAYGASPERLQACIGALNRWTEMAFSLVCDEFIAANEELMDKQSEAILELSTPVLELRNKRLIVPLIGVIDSHRARVITESILATLRARRAEILLLDITAVAAVDTQVANHLAQAIEAARLMGVQTIVTGISTEVARALVSLGVDLGNVLTVATLRSGLETADHIQGKAYVEAAELDALRKAAAKAPAASAPPAKAAKP